MAHRLLREARELAGLTQAELAARAGTSQPAVSRYEAGTASPAVETLERLLAASGARLELTTTRIDLQFDVRTPRLTKLRTNRAQIRSIARRHGAANVRVFGSVARGDDGPASDIDLLVDLDVHRVGLIPVMRLRDELEALLDERVDVAPRSALADHVAAQALSEAIPL
jgi:uncharacterized protein